jgi:hypothetical protein
VSTIHVEASKVIKARPEEIYAVLSDYRVGHPAILPKPYFTGLTVEEGGQGAGTRIQVEMKVLGTERRYQFVISEPEPGRVLVETDATAGVTTTFTVEPFDGGDTSRVTIMTNTKASPGFAGIMERLLSPPISRRIYMKELQQLADYVRQKPDKAKVD